MNVQKQEQLIERAKQNPDKLDGFSVKELQVVAYEVMHDAYSRLMDLLGDNEPAQALLRKHNALEFFAYEPDNNDAGDFQNVKEIVADLWAKEETATPSDLPVRTK